MKPSKPSLRLSEMRGPEIEISLRSFNLFDNFFTEFGAGADDFQAEIVEGELAASDKVAWDTMRMILSLIEILDPDKDKDETRLKSKVLSLRILLTLKKDFEKYAKV